jgi:lipopolysaccharide export system protein LptC
MMRSSGRRSRRRGMNGDGHGFVALMDRTRETLDRLVAWSPVLMLGALAALTYWLDAQVQPPSARPDGSMRHDPDLFLQDFKAITFDAQGKPRETLSASRAEHFPDDESAELATPKLSLSEPGRPTLTITADRGRIDGDRNHGDFTGHVRVDREADPAAKDPRSGGPVQLATEALRVDTKQQRAQTDQPVTIEDLRGIIRGQGLEFDNKARTVRIKSRVSGTFQPREEGK